MSEISKSSEFKFDPALDEIIKVIGYIDQEKITKNGKFLVSNKVSIKRYNGGNYRVVIDFKYKGEIRSHRSIPVDIIDKLLPLLIEASNYIKGIDVELDYPAELFSLQS